MNSPLLLFLSILLFSILLFSILYCHCIVIIVIVLLSLFVIITSAVPVADPRHKQPYLIVFTKMINLSPRRTSAASARRRSSISGAPSKEGGQTEKMDLGHSRPSDSRGRGDQSEIGLAPRPIEALHSNSSRRKRRAGERLSTTTTTTTAATTSTRTRIYSCSQ